MEKEPSFIRGVLLTLVLYLLALPVGVIPLVGPLLAITLIPYIAAASGARLVHPRERVPLALTCALIWSGLVTFVMLVVMKEIASGYSPMGFRIDSIAWFVIITFWVMNTLFTILGALHPWRDPFKGPYK
ncbi:MAG: hypothetical protein JW939_05200 [Candidatus Thermoplasmatota archaeon]|nr:hypothetical protein [Candidatus Thermoplasmatota archaeon]